MRVYFVRHGHTVANHLKVHQNHLDPLNEAGRAQAKTVAERFKNIEIDHILTSDYVRAHDTAQEIARATNKKLESCKLLRERNRPSSVVGMRYDSKDAMNVLETIERQRNDPDWHHSDEENPIETLQRAKKLLKYLESRTEENLVMVTHNTFMKFVLTAIIFGESATLEQFDKIYDAFLMDNTGITVCKYGVGLRGGYYKKDSFWKVITWNDHAHLKDIKE